MIQWILFMFSLTLNMIFMFTNHPLAMGFILLIQTTLISMITGLLTYSFWFSYILFIVFLGGMLVLFIYISSLASNEMFSLSLKLFMTSIIFMITMVMIIMFIDKNMNMLSMNFEPKNFNNKISIQENTLLIKMYNYPYNMIIIILMNYLLITLIAIVKITKFSKGPLRPMFN